MVAGLGGPDEIVVGDVEAGPRLPVAGAGLVGLLLRGQAVGFGGALHLEAVLVGAGEEEHVVAAQPVPAGHGVGGDRRVGVADVGGVVDVVDGGGDVKPGHGDGGYRVCAVGPERFRSVVRPVRVGAGASPSASWYTWRLGSRSSAATPATA